MSTQRHFFAAGDDLLPVFESVEAKRSLSYTLCGLFPTRELTSVAAGLNILAFGRLLRIQVPSLALSISLLQRELPL
jgi:hypothetical protein